MTENTEPVEGTQPTESSEPNVNDEVIDLAEDSLTIPPGSVSLISPDEIKENSAFSIALGILILFGVFVLSMLASSVWLMSRVSVTDSKVLMNEAILPMIKEVGNFSTSVFAPLLAFILGYYYSEKKGRK
jgi:hypothetical protein